MDRSFQTTKKHSSRQSWNQFMYDFSLTCFRRTFFAGSSWNYIRIILVTGKHGDLFMNLEQQIKRKISYKQGFGAVGFLSNNSYNTTIVNKTHFLANTRSHIKLVKYNLILYDDISKIYCRRSVRRSASLYYPGSER